MPAIDTATLTAFYLFDIAERIAVPELRARPPRPRRGLRLDVAGDRGSERALHRERGARGAGRGYVRAAHHLHSVFIDVNEIADHTQNALKMVGDIYAARLFHLTDARLGLEIWKGSVDEKLKTLNDIYRFGVEQVAISRGHFAPA